MRPPQQKLLLKQLDQTLARARHAIQPLPSGQSWITLVRNALGMSATALARRLGLSQPTVAQAERAEVSGQVTLATLAKYADALDCDVIHLFLPRTSLAETLDRQIGTVAQMMVSRTAHSMALENQRPGDKALEAEVTALRNELRRTLPRYLWDPR